MSACPTCGSRDYLCQQCKMDELEDRLGLPEEHFDPDAGIVCWVQDLDEDWHASMYFEGTRHVTACGEVFETPVADVRDDPRRLSETSTCDACEAALEDDANEASADGGFEKASEMATDGGLEEVFRRETIVGTDDGMAIGEDAVPEDDREIRTDGGLSLGGTCQLSPTDSLKSCLSTIEKDVLPHVHPLREPSGKRSPSAVSVAANAVPHWSQVARQDRLSSSFAISYRSKTIPRYLDLSESATFYQRLLQPDKARSQNNADPDDESLNPATKRDGGELR